MPLLSTPKIDIATELLHSSLQHFYSDPPKDFSAICLAGAAEELFGKHVESKGGISAFASLREGAVRILSSMFNTDLQHESVTRKEIGDLMNKAKNSTKHMGISGDDFIHFNPHEEAKNLIDRAMTNFYHASKYFDLIETDLMLRFNSEQVSDINIV